MVIDDFADTLDYKALGFTRIVPGVTAALAYHLAVLLKIFICGYLNRIQSSRRLEKETRRNVEMKGVIFL